MSNEIITDIKKVCPICKDDSSLFYTNNKNTFHLAHYYYSINQLEDSFEKTSFLLEKTNKLNQEEKFILFFLRGDILYKKHITDNAIKNFKKALLHKNKKLKSPNRVYSLLSDLYIKKAKYKEVIFFLEQWRQSYLTNKELYEADINFHNLGISYLHLKKYKKAEENLLISHKLNIQAKDTTAIAYSSSDLANLYYVQYKDSLAITYFKKGLKYAKIGNDLAILQSAYENMAVVEENRKNYKKSLFYRKNYEKIKDSIFDRDKIWNLAQRDKEIAVEIAEKKIIEEKDQKKRILLFSEILFFFLIILSVLAFKINKQRKFITTQRNDLEELNVFKNNLLTILGHDLRSPMHNILQINNQAGHFLKEKKYILLAKTLTNGRITANNMYFLLDNLLHWMLLQTDQISFFKEHLSAKNVVKQVVSNFTPLLQKKNITLSIEIPDMLRFVSDFNSIRVVLRNVLDNAIKFTPENGNILINGKMEEVNTIISIIDSGLGFNSEATKPTKPTKDTLQIKSTGFGLKICNSFMALNNGNFIISSKPQKGTIVTLILKNRLDEEN